MEEQNDAIFGILPPSYDALNPVNRYTRVHHDDNMHFPGSPPVLRNVDLNR